jgi:hypothetical protein
MDHFWRELDDAVLACLANGDDTPSEIGRQLGISEPAASSILTMLAVEGRVRISRVTLGDSQVAGAPPAEPIA